MNANSNSNSLMTHMFQRLLEDQKKKKRKEKKRKKSKAQKFTVAYLKELSDIHKQYII